MSPLAARKLERLNDDTKGCEINKVLPYHPTSQRTISSMFRDLCHLLSRTVADMPVSESSVTARHHLWHKAAGERYRDILTWCSASRSLTA